mgnify:FL=1
MTGFEEKHSVINKEDMQSAMDFVEEFSHELSKYPHRITASKDETACARAIRNRLHDETDAKTRLEAFNTPPLLGRGSFLLLGIWYALCYVVYFVSFAGGRVAGALVTLLSLVMFLSGGSVIILMYLGSRKAGKILPKKVSYNVVSESCKDEKNVKNTLVICDNHDATLGSPIKDFNLVRKLSMIIAPLSVFVFVLFCILKMAIGTQGDNVAAKISAFTILPFVSGIFGIAAFVLHFSPMERFARENNGVATAVAMATYAYFAEQPELLADNTKIVYVSFGAENSGHGGSNAFLEAHPEFASAKVLAIGDVLSDNFQVAERDALRNIDFSIDVVSAVHASAIEQGITVSTMPHDSFLHKFNSLHGFISNAFAKNGNPTATILAKDYSKRDKSLSKSDLENLFSLCVGAAMKIMAKEDNAPKTFESVIATAPSSEMKIVDVESK